MRAILTLAFALLAGCSDSSISSTNSDLEGADLSSDDKAFLSKLATPTRGWRMLSTGSMVFQRPDLPIADRSLSLQAECSSPKSLTFESWQVGDSAVPSNTSGARYERNQLSLKYFDPSTGSDITCDQNYFNVSGKDSIPYRWTAHLSSISSDSVRHELDESAEIVETKGSYRTTGNRSGTIRLRGLILQVDTFSFVESQVGFEHKRQELWGSFHIEGTFFAAILRKSTTGTFVQGDIYRSQLRIGTFKILSDSAIRVLDLDGKAISPQAAL